MENIRKFLAVVCAFLFVITALAALFLFNLERKAFSPETYQQAFANENFYERLPAVLAESLSTTLQAKNLPLSMRGLTTQNWETFLRALLPSAALKSMGDEALDSIFAYLNRKTDSAVLSLAPLKEQMLSEKGTQAVLDLMHTQPECTFQQIAQMTLAILNQQELSLCDPPQAAEGIVRPIIHTQLQIVTAAFPDQVTIASSDAASGKTDPRKRLETARLLMRLSPLAPLTLLLLLTLLTVRKLRDWLRWWGYPFLVTGALAALFAIAAGPLIGAILLQILAARLPVYLPAILLNDSGQLAAAIVGQMLKPVAVAGLILGIAGLILIILDAAFFRSQRTKTRGA